MDSVKYIAVDEDGEVMLVDESTPLSFVSWPVLIRVSCDNDEISVSVVGSQDEWVSLNEKI